MRSDGMKAILEPSVPSMIPNPCASIFLTTPVIFVGSPVGPLPSFQHVPRSLVGQGTSPLIVLSLSRPAVCRINEPRKGAHFLNGPQYISDYQCLEEKTRRSEDQKKRIVRRILKASA